MRRRHELPFGAESIPGGVRFRLWAPRAEAVSLRLEGSGPSTMPMVCEGEGRWALTTATARPGSRYRYVVDGRAFPDPASRRQPEGVHGSSEVVDPEAYEWSDLGWRGRRWEEIVLYELHLGAFSETGDFDGAVRHLDHLRRLGATAVELMPIGEFPGERNWGYDGVFPFAPSSRYGRPEALKRLIEACHVRGLAILLDVVYNHFGPEGNYLPAIAPDFFTKRQQTPWGAAIDFTGPQSRPVRDFFIHNALYWLEEYQFDGLRLDAVHAIFDDGRPDIVDEIGETVRQRIQDREIHLVLENDRNEARRLVRRNGRIERFNAQWNDDLHHALHVLITGETAGFYGDYAIAPAAQLGRALAEGFAYQGELSPFRGGRRRGEPAAELPPTAFIAFLQNHDHIGNRPFGTRLASKVTEPALHAGSAIVLLSPQIPMLFMGEEWASRQSFAFFCDFGPDLAEAVREGRRREFAHLPDFQDEAARERIPDPTDAATFAMSKLDWTGPEKADRARWLARYRALLEIRWREIVPRLAGMPPFAGRYRALGPQAVIVEWQLGDRSRLILVANFSAWTVPFPDEASSGQMLYSSAVPGAPVSASFFHAAPRPPRDMTGRAALVRLAGLVGIETRYTDALGQTREASNETLLALIGAFGLPSNPVKAAAELAERERTPPLGLAPAHLVHFEETSPKLPVRLPARCREIAWTCHLEGGEERGGKAAVKTGLTGERFMMPLPAGLPPGYHRLALEAGGVAAQLDLIVAPARCHLPPQLGPGARSWGLTCQLYGLRSARDWGMGDLTDLASICGAAGACGAAALGINPLHARFMAEPLHFSPYAPSSRTRLDYLYIDPTAMPGFAEDERVQALIAGEWFGATRWAARSAELIDYGAVAACKKPVLEALCRRFQALDLDDDGAARTGLGASFRRFQQREGRSLREFAIFETLHEHYCRERRGFSWRNWPAAMRDPHSSEVAEFAAAHRDRVEFFQFLQWEADRQLAAAAEAGHEAGLSIGLYRDLAVGADPNGAEAWADQELVAPHASIGAPPDPLSRAGQNWGLAPINPLVLRRQGFAPFIACLRANMQHAGILRIDHVMSLNRLYWIPNGMAATDGCYVKYPFDDLLRLVALESCRHGCSVIGEDLGTVPPGFRETMRAANLLSYRIMTFERHHDGGFATPAEYPPLAAASAATHDLATLAGFWLGRDITWRRQLGLYPDGATETAEEAARSRDRRLLLRALVVEGLLEPEDLGRYLSEGGEPTYSPDLGNAIQCFLARSRARLMLVQLEDVVGETEQANLPGTIDEHPNWRRHLSSTIENIIDGSKLRRTASIIEEARRRSAQA